MSEILESEKKPIESNRIQAILSLFFSFPLTFSLFLLPLLSPFLLSLSPFLLSFFPSFHLWSWKRNVGHIMKVGGLMQLVDRMFNTTVSDYILSNKNMPGCNVFRNTGEVLLGEKRWCGRFELLAFLSSATQNGLLNQYRYENCSNILLKLSKCCRNIDNANFLKEALTFCTEHLMLTTSLRLWLEENSEYNCTFMLYLVFWA